MIGIARCLELKRRMDIDTKKLTPTHSSELGVMHRPESDADRR